MVKLFVGVALIDVIAVKANKRCPVVVHATNRKPSMFVITKAVECWSVGSGISHEKKTAKLMAVTDVPNARI